MLSEMRTLDAKNHQTFTCNQMQLERKVRNWEISPTCDSRRSSQSRRPFHVSSFEEKQVASVASACPSTIYMHMHMHMYPQYAQADANLHLHARPSGPLNVFDPWSKLFYKYIHVRRAWPSLGQVHSEFGSELEQPLATRLHWTKGNRNTSDKLSKNRKQHKNLTKKIF